MAILMMVALAIMSPIPPAEPAVDVIAERENLNSLRAAMAITENASRALIDCAADRLERLSVNRIDPASEIAAAAVDGCTPENTALSDAIHSQWRIAGLSISDAEHTIDRGRMELIRSLAAFLVEHRSTGSRQ